MRFKTTKLTAISLIIAFLVMGCAHSQTSRPKTSLTNKAHDTYLLKGDTTTAGILLNRALKHNPNDTKALFRLADILDSTGQPAKALSLYFKTISSASRCDDCDVQDCDAQIIAATMAIVAMRNRVEKFNTQFINFYNQQHTHFSKLPYEAVYQLRNLNYAISLHTSTQAPPLKALEQVGCFTHWQTAGSFGPLTFASYEQKTDDYEQGKIPVPWPSTFNLGKNRGLVKNNTKKHTNCFINPTSPKVSSAGTGIARTTFQLKNADEVHFRIETTGSVTVYVGGEKVYSKDTRQAYLPPIDWFQVALPKGIFDLTVIAANGNGAPSFSLVAMDASKKPLSASQNPKVLSTTRLTNLQYSVTKTKAHLPTNATLANLRAAIFQNNFQKASSILSVLPQSAVNTSPVINTIRGESIIADPAVPIEQAFESARKYMLKALKGNPRLHQARTFLTRQLVSDENINKGLSLLKQGFKLNPKEPSLFRLYADLTHQQGWHAETAQAVKQLSRLTPTVCNTLYWKVAVAKQQNKLKEAEKIAQQIRHCDASAELWAQIQNTKFQFETALDEYKRISKINPQSNTALRNTANAALAGGDISQFIQYNTQALSLAPNDAITRISIADAHLANTDKSHAVSLLEESLALLNNPQPLTEAAYAFVNNSKKYEEYRVDGEQLIDAFKRKKIVHNTAATWVLDRSVHLINANGSRTEIVHHIAKVNSKEGVLEHGELAIPSNAILLNARTIKKDGEILWPVNIKHKSTLSLPDLEPGDFVEAEYVSFFQPSNAHPGGTDTGRFYFQDFITTFYRSEVIYITPKSMELVADPRGNCPKPHTQNLGDYNVTTYQIRETLPKKAEAHGPSPTEYFPSIRMVSGYSWDSFCAEQKDLLADKNKISKLLTSAVRAILGKTKSNTDSALQKIYHWVQQNVDNTGDIYEQPSHILQRKAGSRAKLFLGLINAMGTQGKLAFVKSLGNDDTVTQVPNPNEFERVVVLVGKDNWINFDYINAPYGFLPPELRNRPAFILNDCKVVQTTSGIISKDSRDVKMTINIDPQGAAKISIFESISGMDAIIWREKFETIAKSEIKKTFQNSYLSYTMGSAKFDSLTVHNQKKPALPLLLEYSFSIEHFAREENGSWHFSVPPLSSKLTQSLGGLVNRETPLIVSTCHFQNIATTIMLPKGFEFAVNEESNFAHSQFGNATMSIKRNSNSLATIFTKEVCASRVETTDYNEFWQFALKLDDISDISLDYKPTNSLNSNIP